MCDIIKDCHIKPGYRSDHSIIELSITINKFKVGKGVWKFNNNLLKNLDYLDLINNTIQNEVLKYAIPVYNLDFIKTNYKSLNFVIDHDLFLEVLFLRIRGETIKFATTLKKENNIKENELKRDIEHLESNQDLLNPMKNY